MNEGGAMPQRPSAPSLVNLVLGQVGHMLTHAFLTLDSEALIPKVAMHKVTRVQLSPFSAKHLALSPPESAPCSMGPKYTQLKTWLSALPFTVWQSAFHKVLWLMEETLLKDKEKRLIHTIINLAHCKLSDLTFGIHSFMLVLIDSGIQKLPFSRTFWTELREYELLTTTRFVQHCMLECLPGLTNLTEINLSLVANDFIMHAIGKHCCCLEVLCLDLSQVSDHGILYLSSSSGRASSTKISSSVQLLDTSDTGLAGCPRLRVLSLENCSNVSQSGIWQLLQHCPCLQLLSYNNNYSTSVAEIIFKAYSQNSDLVAQYPLQQLHISALDFSYPFLGLSLAEDSFTRAARHCPDVTMLNFTTNDCHVQLFRVWSQVRRLNLELEDCFGMGLLGFLSSPIGVNLVELSLSCSSDPDAPNLDVPGGGQAHQLFNVGLCLTRQFCPNLEKLCIFGCGLVSSRLMDHLAFTHAYPISQPPQPGEQPRLKKLRSLILFTYFENDDPAPTCHDQLLLRILQDAWQLECLSLEGNFSAFMDDGYLARVLRANPMHHLRILDIRGTKLPLSIVSAKRCLQLQSIQELRITAWSVTDTEMQLINQEIRQQGWTLKLTTRES